MRPPAGGPRGSGRSLPAARAGARPAAARPAAPIRAAAPCRRPSASPGARLVCLCPPVDRVADASPSPLPQACTPALSLDLPAMGPRLHVKGAILGYRR
jgi:hypothetical protein